MAARARRVEEEQTVSIDIADLVRRVESNPAIVLTDEETFEAYYAYIEQQALKLEVDLSTSAGRDLIRSAASEIARKKTAFDRTRKELTEDYRRKTATINAVGKLVVDRFAALQARVRHPLTVWEEREEARKQEADAILADLRNAAIVRAEETADDVRKRLDRIRGINLNDELFGPRIDMATDLRDEAVAALSEALARLVQQEEERVELERLRRAEAERQERKAREKREREDREAEERRKADEQRRADEAAEKARRDAEDAAHRAHQEELDRIEREKQAEIDAANERARLAEEARQNEANARATIQHIKDCAMGFIGGQPQPLAILHRELHTKIVIDETFGALRGEAERELIAAISKIQDSIQKEIDDEAEAQRIAERQADQEYRTAVRRAAKEAIMSCGADEETARKIVLAIQAGEVPAVRIEF